MSTRRAQNHKDLVALEKKYHHQPGMHVSQHRKVWLARWSNSSANQ